MANNYTTGSGSAAPGSVGSGTDAFSDYANGTEQMSGASGGGLPRGREYQIGTVSDRVRRKITKLEELRVVAAAGASDEVIQRRTRWLDGSRVPGYLMFVEILGNTNGKLVLQTSMGEEGPWKDVATYTAITATTVFVSSEGDDALLAGMLRYKLTGTAANWKVCFRLQATPMTRRS